jgi:hypothetical protein
MEIKPTVDMRYSLHFTVELWNEDISNEPDKWTAGMAFSLDFLQLWSFRKLLVRFSNETH